MTEQNVQGSYSSKNQIIHNFSKSISQMKLCSFDFGKVFVLNYFGLFLLFLYFLNCMSITPVTPENRPS